MSRDCIRIKYCKVAEQASPSHTVFPSLFRNAKKGREKTKRQCSTLIRFSSSPSLPVHTFNVFSLGSTHEYTHILRTEYSCKFVCMRKCPLLVFSDATDGQREREKSLSFPFPAAFARDGTTDPCRGHCEKRLFF